MIALLLLKTSMVYYLATVSTFILLLTAFFSNLYFFQIMLSLN